MNKVKFVLATMFLTTCLGQFADAQIFRRAVQRVSPFRGQLIQRFQPQPQFQQQRQVFRQVIPMQNQMGQFQNIQPGFQQQVIMNQQPVFQTGVQPIPAQANFQGTLQPVSPVQVLNPIQPTGLVQPISPQPINGQEVTEPNATGSSILQPEPQTGQIQPIVEPELMDPNSAAPGPTQTLEPELLPEEIIQQPIEPKESEGSSILKSLDSDPPSKLK